MGDGWELMRGGYGKLTFVIWICRPSLDAARLRGGFRLLVLYFEVLVPNCLIITTSNHCVVPTSPRPRPASAPPATHSLLADNLNLSHEEWSEAVRPCGGRSRPNYSISPSADNNRPEHTARGVTSHSAAHATMGYQPRSPVLDLVASR